MSVLSSDLDPGDKALTNMAPVAKNLPSESYLPHSSHKTISLSPACNGESQQKKSSVTKRKNFFKRALSSDKLIIENRKNVTENSKTESNGYLRVEITPKDVAEESENYQDSNSDELTPDTPLSTRAFENDDSERLRPDSLYHSACVSDDESLSVSAPDSPDKNRASIMSVTSNISQSERVVQEIIATEQTYVKDLEEIINGYLKNMRSKESPFTKEEVDDLFMNIEEIHKFNKHFLEELDMCGDDPVQVALCFVEIEKDFEIYTDYCTKYPKSVEVLTECTTKKETASFLQHMQVKLKHALPLGSYLLKPVQRILKYRLLLKDIKKHFGKDSDQEGYDIIVEALSVMTDVAHYINEMKRKHEAAVHVQEVQSQLTDFEGPDLTTYGKLVLEDSFRMQGTKTERYLFLFEKILLITKKRENSFSCKFAIKCDNMMMTESVPKEPLGFQVIRFDNQKINYSFLARNMEQKQKWMLELKRLIVESLAARVPMRAKALILGEKNVEEGSQEPKRRPLSSHHLQRASSFRGSPSGIKKDSIIEEKKEETDAKLGPDSKTGNKENKTEKYDRDHSIPGSHDAPVSIHVEDWERKSVTEDHESNSKPPCTGGLNNSQSSKSEKENLVHHGNGVIIGRRGSSESMAPNKNDLSRPSECTDIKLTEKGKTKTGGGTLPRKRTTEPVGPVGLRNRSWSGGNQIDDSKDVMKEFGNPGLVTPRVPKRSSSLKHLRSHLSGSFSDTTSVGSDSDGYTSEGVFEDRIDRGLGDIAEISAVKQTVREVRRAFSFSDSTKLKKEQGSPNTNVRRTRVAETASQSSEFPSKRPKSKTLDDLLASIDRDLDETRHTISKAQLLESALRVRREGRSRSPILEVDGEDDVISTQRRTPVQELLHNWKMAESEPKRDALARQMIANKPQISSNTMSKFCEADTNSVAVTKKSGHVAKKEGFVTKKRDFVTKKESFETKKESLVTKKDSLLTTNNNDQRNAFSSNKSKVDHKPQVPTGSSKTVDDRKNTLFGSKATESRKAKIYGSSAINRPERKAASTGSFQTGTKGTKSANIDSLRAGNTLSKNENTKPVLLSRNSKKTVFEKKERDQCKVDENMNLTREETRTVKLKLRERTEKKPSQHSKLSESPFQTFADHTTSVRCAKSGIRDDSKETEWKKIPDGSKLSSVYKMARQYSQKITDDREVRDLRSRLKEGQRTQKGLSSVRNNNDYTKVNASPEMKVKRVTKVKFENKTLQDLAVVRRRRKPLGRGRDYRSSWSYQKVKSELQTSAVERLDRPKSEEIGAPFDFIEECDDDTAELDRDNAVSKGVVKQLITKFDAGK